MRVLPYVEGNRTRMFGLSSKILHDHSKVLFVCLRTFVMCLLLITSFFATAQTTETIPVGSKIINMGITPQTAANGLKPYGLVYALLKAEVPIKWIINPSKSKDGIDFVHNGVSYKGSAFIIDAGYLSASITSIINTWTAKGVIVNTTVSAFTVSVTVNLKSPPFWVLDAQNGKIAEGFIKAAEIPSTAYIFKSPFQLTRCDDIYVMPHADPTWAEHKNLWYWNRDYKGSIWAGCHAVSVLENVYGADIVTPATTRRLNFLMNDGTAGFDKNALSFRSHGKGTPPYVASLPSHPFMQYMGKTDLAHTNGSEQIFMPYKPGGSWRSTTSLASIDPSQADVPGLSTGPAAVVAFGSAFGDTARGMVMYEGGHNIGGTGVDNIAAQRVFFNFSFYTAFARQFKTSMSNVPSVVYGNQTYYNLSVSVPILLPGSAVSYQWTSSCGGAFSSANSRITNFTAPDVSVTTQCIITCKITDECGRVTFESAPVTVIPLNRPPACTGDAGIVPSCLGNMVTVNVLANDSEPDADPMTVTLMGQGAYGTFTNLGNGNISYVPTSYFTGSDQVQYRVCDDKGLCCFANLTISVNLNDANGCRADEYYGVASTITALRATQVSGSVPTGLANTLGTSDGVVGDATTYGNFSNTNMVINFTLSAALPAAGNIKFFVDGSSGKQFTVTQSSDSITFSNSQTFTIASTEDFLESTAKIYSASAGTKFLKVIFPSQPVLIDAMEYNVMSCLSSYPIAGRDVASVLEDMPVKIDVLSNDIDPEGLGLTVVSIASQPLYGRVSINTDGTITYLNTKDQIGTGVDSFSYRVVTYKGVTSTGVVVVNITEDNCSAGLYKPFTTTSTITSTLNPTADNYLRLAAVTSNYGTTDIKVKGELSDLKRGLVQFNLSAIPSNAIIDSASLMMYHNTNSGSEIINIYRINRAWTETGSTWSTYNGTNNWTTAGGDFDTTVYSTLNVGATTNVYKNWNIKSLAQAWTSGSLANYGLMMRRYPEVASGSFKDMKFSPREGSSSEYPKLYVAYRVPGTCTTIPAYAPLAMPDTATTNSVTAVTINVSLNDFDYNATGMTVALLTSTSKRGGALTLSGNNIIYTPPVTTPKYNGVDTFKYKVTSSSLVDSAFVYVLVTNAPPNVNPDFYNMPSSTGAAPNSSVNDVTINDSDPEGLTLSSPVILVAPSQGIATVSGNQITYTPNYNYYGKDSLVYQRTEISAAGCYLLSDTAKVIYNIQNQAPVGVLDSTSINACETVILNVLSNDTDPEGNNLVITSFTQPDFGTVALTNNNTQFLFTPPAGMWNLMCTFTYVACDPGTPALCTGTVTSKVKVRPPPPKNNEPLPVRDTFFTNLNAVLYADVLTNDVEPDGQDFVTPLTITTNPLHGTAVPLSNGLIQYTPNNNYYGLDSFLYRVYDSIEVQNANMGSCDKIVSKYGEAWVLVVIQDAPLANVDYKAVNRNASATDITVLTNDIFGYDGPATGTISIVTMPTRGTLTVNGGLLGNQSDDKLIFTPTANYSGRDSAIYRICDSNGDCDTAMVYILIKGDNDGDGIMDDIDIDDDNDGITDYIETCGNAATTFSCTTGGADPNGDTDQDGLVNWKDADYGTLNANGCNTSMDTDGDGVPNFFDLDSDNDGVPDVVEAYGVDANGDGLIDNYSDTDADGLSQNVDGNNTGAAGSGYGLGFQDFDGDGIPNTTDLDSDNDGIPDIIEVGGTDSDNNGRVDGFADTDLDGFTNAYDADANGDGVVENTSGPLLKTGADTNSDGRADSYPNKNIDQLGKPNPYDLDADGDGITDAIEAGFPGTVTVSNGIVSGAATSGWANSVAALSSFSFRNSDNRGNPNFLDIDSDDDGISDNIEGQPTYSYTMPTDTDADGDGLNDVFEVSPGTFGGGGITPYDHDADGFPDHLDTDSDNDGAPDINEASLQFSLTQSNINLTDTDGDGMIDQYDNITVTSMGAGLKYMNLTNSNMGTGGNFNGPLPSGSNVLLVKSQISGGDRDWRNSGILPLQIVNFTGNLQSRLAHLKWLVNNEIAVDYYVVQRSFDGVRFDSIGKVAALNQNTTSYSFNDDLAQLTFENVYYRIRQVNKTGREFITQVVVFGLGESRFTNINAFPNPATTQVTVQVRSLTREPAQLIFSDMFGRTIFNKTYMLEKGQNNILVTDIAKFARGMYMLKVKTLLQEQLVKIARQ